MSQKLINVPINFLYHDLYLDNYGIEQCYPNKLIGPMMREYYLIHYVLSGKGIFKVGDETYELEEGTGFLIQPSVETTYQADHSDPWNYCWVGFHGIQAQNILNETSLLNQSPVFSYDMSDTYFQQFLSILNQEDHNTIKMELAIHGLLFLLLSSLIEKNPKQQRIGKPISKEDYIHKVIHFIESNYSNKITIASIAEWIGLDRSYLSGLFKEFMGISIKEYLIQFRIKKACVFLNNSKLSIGSIARSVGYEDPLLFSKMFKKTIGTSPSEFRNR